MKKLLWCSLTVLLFSCQPATERHIGFHPNPDKDVAGNGWYLGTNEAIDVVVELDKVWKKWDYESMRTFFADSVQITTSRGQRYLTPEAYFTPMKERDFSNYSWEIMSVHSVDIKPGEGGEHVQARLKNSWKDTLGNTNNSYSIESYYVVDGKIVWLDQFVQRPVKENAED